MMRGWTVLAVCALTPLAAAQDEPRVASQAEIDAAIEKGVEFLLEGDRRHTLRGGGRTGALVLYALIKSDVTRDHPRVVEGFLELARADVAGTYYLACALLAVGTLDGEGQRDWMHDLAQQLIDTQTSQGDWGYPSGADLSNTQYAALGLRAAAQAGVAIAPEVWERLADGVLRYQGTGGSFGYRRGNGSGTGSMTAAGVGTLAICDGELTRLGELSTMRGGRLASARERGLVWLGKNFSVERNPFGGWLYYYLYGLERVGALAGVTRIGGHDWYAEGAAKLVRDQATNGSWPGGVVQTSFALLFLQRATRPKTGAHAAGKRRYGTVGRTAAVQVAAAGDTPLSMWISGWGEAALGDFIWSGEERKGPHVLRVEYLAGEQLLGVVQADRGAPAEAERFAWRHSFRAAGTYAIRARVHVATPRTKDEFGRVRAGRVEAFESEPFEVEVRDVVPAWQLAQKGDPARNRLPQDAGVKASSTLSSVRFAQTSVYGPHSAIDRRGYSSWLADPGDDLPTLELSFSKPVRADTLLISNARTVPHVEGYYARALEVRVVINGKDEYTVRMHMDERRKGRLLLEKAVKVKTLELEIPLKVPGTASQAVGFSEVELQLRGGDER